MALSAYREKLARLGLEREPLWTPSYCCDSEQSNLYHAAGRTLGALTGDDYDVETRHETTSSYRWGCSSIEYRASCSTRAEDWARSRAQEVDKVMGCADWAVLASTAGMGLEHAVPSSLAVVRALAIALQRTVVLLNSEAPDSDRIDRRGLVYVFHPDFRVTRKLRADEDLHQEILAGCPADAYAWGEFPRWWQQHLAAVEFRGWDSALVLVYDAVKRCYAGTVREYSGASGRDAP